MVLIREYNSATDFSALRTCFIELQSWERRFEPSLPEPETAADPYVADMLKSCAESCGRVFVAEAAGAVVAFVCVLGSVMPQADESFEPNAYISDLVVRTAHRGRGIGRKLIAQAEAFARETGVKRIKVGVLVRNERTHELYRECGFRDYAVQLVKAL